MRFLVSVLLLALLLALSASPAYALTVRLENDGGAFSTLNGSNWGVSGCCGVSGTMSFSNVSGEWYEFSFTGNSFILYGSYFSNRGICDVYLDSSLIGSYDAYGPTATPQQPLFSWSVTPGSHTVRVQVTGTRNSSATDQYCEVDFIEYDDGSGTPTPTVVPTDTPTPTVVPTDTLTPSVTPSPIPSTTPTQTPTFTITPLFGPSATITPSPTITFTPTATPVVRVVGVMPGYSALCFDPINPVLVPVMAIINFPSAFGLALISYFAGPDGLCYPLEGTGPKFYFLQLWVFLFIVGLYVLSVIALKDRL